jgi:hypothetical protein
MKDRTKYLLALLVVLLFIVDVIALGYAAAGDKWGRVAWLALYPTYVALILIAKPWSLRLAWCGFGIPLMLVVLLAFALYQTYRLMHEHRRLPRRGYWPALWQDLTDFYRDGRQAWMS